MRKVSIMSPRPKRARFSGEKKWINLKFLQKQNYGRLPQKCPVSSYSRLRRTVDIIVYKLYTVTNVISFTQKLFFAPHNTALLQYWRTLHDEYPEVNCNVHVIDFFSIHERNERAGPKTGEKRVKWSAVPGGNPRTPCGSVATAIQPPWLALRGLLLSTVSHCDEESDWSRAACRAGFISTCARARSSTGGAEN